MSSIADDIVDEKLKWLIGMARCYYDTNVYRAKSMLFTGLTLFPDNIALKMEFYRLAKSSKMLSEAAQHFSAMISLPNSENYKDLQKELEQLVKSVQSSSETIEDKMNIDIFSALPEEQQCSILKGVSMRSPDALSRCSVLLLLVKRFPKLSKEYGTTLIETLFEAELKESPRNVNNVYRRYFVSDAFPMMLKDNPGGADRKILLNWLDKALQYYIVTTFLSSKDGLMSPTHATAQSALVKQHLSRPWDSMTELLLLMSKQVKWNVSPSHYSDSSSMLHYLESLRVRLLKEHSKSLKKEFLYNITFLYLKLAYQYVSLAKKSGNVCLLQQNFKLISKKHKKNIEFMLSIASAEGVQNPQQLITTFKLACQAWEKVHSEATFVKAFDELMDRLDYPRWKHVLTSFERDRTLFQQDYDSCIKYDMHSGEAYSIQNACCLFAVGKVKDAVAEVIGALTKPNTHQMTFSSCSLHKPPTDEKAVDAAFIFTSQFKDLVACGVKIITHAVKEALLKDPGNDEIKGHLCVLIQYDWPAQKTEFLKIIGDIKVSKKFVYQYFFDYIINLDMLEEFAYIGSEQGSNVSLDIVPVTSQKFTKARAVTRGVAKDVKEDFKALFEKQVARSVESANSLVLRFLLERKQDLLTVL